MASKQNVQYPVGGLYDFLEVVFAGVNCTPAGLRPWRLLITVDDGGQCASMLLIIIVWRPVKK